MNATPPPSRGFRLRDPILAVVMIAVGAALAFLTPERMSPELAQRVMGVMLGCFVMFYANEAPKALPRRLESRCGSAAHQRIRRFAGWTLALGGLGFTIAWLAAPIGIAGTLAIGVMGTAFLIVLVRVRRMSSSGPRP